MAEGSSQRRGRTSVKLLNGVGQHFCARYSLLAFLSRWGARPSKGLSQPTITLSSSVVLLFSSLPGRSGQALLQTFMEWLAQQRSAVQLRAASLHQQEAPFQEWPLASEGDLHQTSHGHYYWYFMSASSYGSSTTILTGPRMTSKKTESQSVRPHGNSAAKRKRPGGRQGCAGQPTRSRSHGFAGKLLRFSCAFSGHLPVCSLRPQAYRFARR